MTFVFLLSMTQGEGQQVFLPNVGLKLEFPAPWVVRTEGVEPLAAVAELPPKRALVLVTRTLISQGEPREKGLDDLLASLERSFSKHEILRNEKISLASGLKATVVEIRGTARGRTLRHLTYLFSGYGERFSITFASEDKTSEALKSDFAGIIKTLALTGPKKEDRLFLELMEKEPVDFAALEALLAAGANINAANRQGQSALTLAIFQRKGLLVKWLLEKGVDLEDPMNNMSFLTLVATPPILELLKRTMKKGDTEGQKGEAKEKPQEPKGLEIQWASPETAVFAGITNGRIAYVRKGLEMGADLSALDDNYRLPPLAMTRQLIREFEELGLDASKLKPIEAELVEAMKKVKKQEREEQ